MNTNVITPYRLKFPPRPLGGVVEESGGARLVDPIDHALDQAGGFVLFGETETEARHGLGHVEGLPVVVVVAAVEKLFVDPLLGFLDEAFPDADCVLWRGRNRAVRARRRPGRFPPRVR
jgi:hypothetical protein